MNRGFFACKLVYYHEPETPVKNNGHKTAIQTVESGYWRKDGQKAGGFFLWIWRRGAEGFPRGVLLGQGWGQTRLVIDWGSREEIGS
jgi:hypothetical protein